MENKYAIPATYHNEPSDFMKELSDVCYSCGCVQVSADDMYRDIFPPDTIQSIRLTGKDEDGHKGNPLVLIRKNDSKGKPKHVKRILFDDYEYLHKWKEIEGVQHVWLSGLTYIGKQRRLDRAVSMNAMIFDIDYMTVKGLETLFYQAQHDIIPLPNYIVLSGSGIHAYYVFNEPIPLYHGSYGRRVKSQLNRLKHEMTTALWNPHIVGRKNYEENIQYQSINQAFRLVGSYTKALNQHHDRYTVVAFQTTAKPYEITDLYRYVTFAEIPEEERYRGCSIRGLDYWKEKNPEWYERRIVQGDKSIKYWHVNRCLYDWWIKQVREKARYGHRYNCLFCTVVFAIKCDIDYDELERDLISFLPRFEYLNPDDPITEDEVREALASYDERLNTYPSRSIEYLSGIEMEHKQIKRNGRTRYAHIKQVNAVRKFKREQLGENTYENNGRPDKRKQVKMWRLENPDGTMYRCAKETGMSKNTVKKWWS